MNGDYVTGDLAGAARLAEDDTPPAEQDWTADDLTGQQDGTYPCGDRCTCERLIAAHDAQLLANSRGGWAA